jgi:hypothetical protein
MAEPLTRSRAARRSSSGSTRHIGDFTRWKEHDTYQKAFDRLLRDLRVEEA